MTSQNMQSSAVETLRRILSCSFILRKSRFAFFSRIRRICQPLASHSRRSDDSLPLSRTVCFGFDSLASRLRFVLGYNRTIAFEAVESGMFLSAYERDKLWDRLTKPCSLKLGERTHVRLEVLENVFQLSLGGKVVMTARVAGYAPHPAHWAIIAWNGFSPEPVGMRMEIENLKVLVRDGR